MVHSGGGTLFRNIRRVVGVTCCQWTSWKSSILECWIIQRKAFGQAQHFLLPSTFLSQLNGQVLGQKRPKKVPKWLYQGPLCVNRIHSIYCFSDVNTKFLFSKQHFVLINAIFWVCKTKDVLTFHRLIIVKVSTKKTFVPFIAGKHQPDKSHQI